MISYLYFCLLLITTGNLIYLAQKKYKHTDRYLWTIVIIIPIIILGYWLKSQVHTPEAAMIAFFFMYLDNLLLVICFFTVLHDISVRVSSSMKVGVYGITLAHLISIWISKDSVLYYASIKIHETYLGSATEVISGPLKMTHYFFIGFIFVCLVVAVIYGSIKKGNYSKKTLRAYIFFIVFAIVVYLIELIFKIMPFSMLPIVYAAGSFAATIKYDHFQSHDIMQIIGEKQSRTGLRGFATFDRKRCLLGYNEQFSRMVPEIKLVRIDEKIEETIILDQEGMIGRIYPAIDRFEQEKLDTQNITMQNHIFNLTVSSFSVNDKQEINGYLVEIADITEETRSREITEKYYEVLSKEVQAKTQHIVNIQNSVVMGLANMVENRDDNTGGHIKRTSDVIKLLVEEIIRRKTYDIDEVMALDIIKAAPMHDLGKIAIDNSILCKPGRLTPEEYEIMKTHAAESGEIVKIILDGVEEKHFVDVAYNVARHHHERWDGKGYPDQMLGEKIPVEARIMAVADVYDALVSKRCYKEAMSFEQAYDIMNECMGSQFDPAIRPVFIACREKLEAYYREEA